MMRRSIQVLSLVWLLVPTVTSAALINIQSTGNGSTIGGTVDPYWTFTNSSGITANAFVAPIAEENFGAGNWVPNSATSSWIIDDPATPQSGGLPLSFQTTFDLTGLDPVTASLSGAWNVDDAGSLTLNGHLISSSSERPDGVFSILIPFSVEGSSGFFVPGTNVLSVVLTAADNTYEGVNVEVSGSANEGCGDSDSLCSDGQFCNGAETCQDSVCHVGSEPCFLLCDEANDRCVTACPPAPQNCRTSGKSLLMFQNREYDGNNSLRWRWRKGSETSQAEFGDPTTTADYALCIYAGATSALVGQSIIPATGLKWRAVSTKGYKYDDPQVTADGVEKVVLKGSTKSKSSVQVKGKGAGLPDLSLPLVAPVTVQLINSDNGLCWGANYTDAQMVKNEMGQLRANAP